MSLTKKIAFNTILHTVGKFSSAVIGIVMVGILTRYLGVEGYGTYTTIFAYLFFFAIVADFGLYVVMVNNLKNNKWGEEKFFNNIFTLRCISAAGCLLSAGILVWFFPYETQVKVGVMVAAVSVFLNLIDQITVAFFQIKLDMKRVAVAEFLGKVVTLALTVWVVSRGGGIIEVLQTVIAGYIINFLINFSYARRLINITFRFDRDVWIKIFRLAWPVALTSVFSLIYFKADTLLLSLLPVNPLYATSYEQAVGIYGAPYKILEALIAWPAIFIGLTAPVLSSAWAEQRKADFERVWQKTFDALGMIIWPMMVGVFVLARPIMVFIAGPEFAASANVFRILIVATGAIFLTHLTTYSIIAIGRQKKMIKYYICAAGAAVVGYVVLIPIYSYYAAAWVTVAVESFMLFSTVMVLKKHAGLKINWSVFGRAMFAAAGMGYVLTFILGINVAWLVLVGGLMYIMLLWAVFGFDLKFIKGIIKRDKV